MRINLLAKRYAKAVFELSVEMNITDKVAKDLRLVAKIIEENRLLRKLLHNPVLDSTKKVKILNAIFGKHISKLTNRFLNLITLKNREQYILFICQAFEKIYLDYKNILSAELTTAIKADEKIRREIIEKLKQITNKKIDLHSQVDENIIGGYIIKLDDYQYDASIANQLKRLKKEFSENLYVKQL